MNLLTSLDLVHATVAENAAPSGANLATSATTTIDRSVIAWPLGGGDQLLAVHRAADADHVDRTSWFDDDNVRRRPAPTP